MAFLSFSGLASSEFLKLEAAMQALERRLVSWASSSEAFLALLLEVYGVGEGEAAEALQSVLLGDGPNLAVELLDGSVLGDAFGGYTNAAPDGSERIYLNASWMLTAGEAEIEAVLLEEIGHAIDWRLNGSSDSAGDEGERFSALLRGVQPSADMELSSGVVNTGALLAPGATAERLEIRIIHDQLNTIAQTPDYWTIFNTAFGSNYNQTLAETLRSQWANRDFSQIPEITILGNNTLKGALGAYSASNNTIYLSDTFVANATDDALSAVILEEIGHFVDAHINNTDAPGDEGELFSLLVRDITPGTERLSRIQAENDLVTITIDGQSINVEEAQLNDTYLNAIPLTLNTPATGSWDTAINDVFLSSSTTFSGSGQGTTNLAGTEVFYTFTAPSAGNYSVRVTVPSASPNFVLYTLYPTQGTLYVTSDEGANRTTTSTTTALAEEIYGLSLTAGQTVYLAVDLTSGTSTANFSIEVTRSVKEIEINDSSAAANLLIFGSEGSIGSTTDVDFYSLGNPAAGSRVFALLDGLAAAGNNFDLRVTDGTNTLEYDNSDAGSTFGENSPSIAGTPLTGSASYLRVSYNTTTSAEPYRLYAVTQPAISSATLEAESNDTLANAQSSPGNYFSGSLSATSDNDFYSFTAQAGDVVFLGLDTDPTRNNTPFDGQLSLFSSDNTILISANDTNATSNTTAGSGLTAGTPNSPSEGLVYRVRNDGTYYARVSAGSTTIGDYLLSISVNGSTALSTPIVGISAVTTNITEDHTGVFRVNRIGGSTASPLTINYTVGGTASNPADFAALSGSVTIPAGQTYADVSVAPVNDNIADPNETVILSLAANPNYAISTPNTSATLTLADAVAGDIWEKAISLNINTPVSGSWANASNDIRFAAPILFNGLSQGSMRATGSDVVYKFTAPSTDAYSFRVTGPTTSAPNFVLYALNSLPTTDPNFYTNIDPANVLGGANRTSSTTTTAEEIYGLSLSAGQTIYLVADLVSGSSTSNFTVEVNKSVKETDRTNLSTVNDTPGTASLLAFGIEGSIGVAGDKDFYTLGTPAAGSRVFAMVDGLAASSSDFDLRITTATNTLEYDDGDAEFPFGGLCTSIAGTILDGSASYLRVNHFSNSTTTEPYRLYAVVQPGNATPETEGNNSIASANSASNNYFSGTLSSITDTDFYSFTAQAGDLVFLSLDTDPTRNNNPFNGQLALLDSANSVLLNVNDGNSSSNTTAGTGLTATTPNSPSEGLVYRILNSGTYYARVNTTVTSFGTGINADYLLSISNNGVVGSNTQVAPTATNLSVAETYTEDTPLDLTDIVVTDSDSPVISATLILSNTAAGSLTTGSSGSVASTFSNGAWTAIGAVADVNALLAGLTFIPTANFDGNFTVTTQVTDGIASAGTATKNFTGIPINDAPTDIILVPTSYTRNNTSSITIPSSGAATPYPSTISASGLEGIIESLQITLNGISHAYPDDLDILLVGPNGAKVMLMSDAGSGNAINSISLTFSSTAIQSLPDSTQITPGTYLPTDFDQNDTLAAPAPAGPYNTSFVPFLGTSPNGIWNLYAQDDAGGDLGSISGGWSLQVVTTLTGIRENTVIGAGVKIGTIAVTDPDSTGNNNILSVEGADGANFEIRNGTELFYIGATPDFETKASYAIVLKSTDGPVIYSKAFAINVFNVNEAPTATADAYTTDEDTTLLIAGPGVLANDSDIEGDSLSAVLVSGPANGSLTLNPDGSFSYTPNPNFNGSDSFSYKANDGNLDSALTTVSITVNPINGVPPVAADDAYTTGEDSTLTIAAAGVLANDSDIDGDSLSAVLLSGPANGSLTLNTNGSFSYAPNPNFHGSDSFSYKANDGNLDSSSATVSITVNPVNDAPLNTVPSAQIVDEDTDLTITGLSIDDVDAAAAPVTVTLAVSSGTITLAAANAVNITDNGTAFVTITGSVAAINTALAATNGVVYRGNLNFNGSDTLTIFTDDAGNSGSGGSLTDLDTVAITVNPVNDAPLNTVPSAQIVDEDTDLTITGLSIDDVDAAAAPVTVTLAVSSGTITIAAANAVNITDNGTGSVSLTGSVAAINTALAATNGVVYRGNLNFNGSDTLTIFTDDGGNSGSGGNLTDLDSVDITVNPVNDAPLNTVPSAQIVDEDTDLTITGLSIDDVDAGSADVMVDLTGINSFFTLGAANVFSFNGIGKVNVGSSDVTINLTVSSGTITVADANAVIITDNGTASVSLTGSVAAINTALAAPNGVVYRGNLNFNGSDTLTIYTDDGGNSGSGGSLTDLDSVDITVNPVNDAPLNTVPSAQIVDEDTDLTITGLSIDDVDAGSADVTVNLAVSSGTLTIAAASAVNITDNGTGSVSLTGSVAAINTALAATNGVVYRGNLNFNGSDTLTIFTDDAGNSGSGGSLTDLDTVAITVNPVNDAPLNTVPSAQIVDEDTDLTITGLSIDDVDAAAAPVTVTLAVSSGTITIAAASDVNITDNGTGSVSLTGSIAAINTALAATNGVVYRGNLNFNGSDSLTIFTDDAGNSGSGGSLTDLDSVDITVNPVNDAPLNTVPSAQIVDEDTDLTITGLSIDDVDAGFADVTVNLTVSNGTITIAAASAVNITDNGTAFVTITGSVAAINTALAATNGVVYRGNLNFNGSDTLTIFTDDAGNSGSGGSLTDLDTVAITVNPVNDAPLNTVPSAQIVDEDTDLTITGLSIDDVDAGSADVTVNLAVSSGTLTVADANAVIITDNGTASVSLTGSVAAINTALAATNGVIYRGNLNFNGSDTLTIFTDDGGNSGSGGSLTDLDTVAITVNPVNDAPLNTVPSAQIVDEDTDLTITGLSIDDVDAGSADVMVDLTGINSFFTLGAANVFSFNGIGKVNVGSSDVTINLTVSSGTITVADANAVIITDNGTASVSLTGSVAAINTALAAPNGVVYRGNLNFNGSDTLTIYTDDGGNSGSGGSLTDLDTVDITVNPVNDAPVNTMPSAKIVDEDTDLAITGLSIDDVDAGSSDVTVNLAVSNGTLTVAAANAVSISNSGSASVSLTGSVAAINTALAAPNGVVYRGNLNFNGSDTLTIYTDDGGNSGSGGSLTDLDSVDITVNPVNDAPVATGSASLPAINEDNTTSTGATVSSLFSSNFSDATDAVTGGSTANTLAGIAISSYTPVNPKGSWQYSTDGSSWSTLNAIASASSAFTLKATDSLRFVPSTNWNGPTPTLTVKLIDSSVSVTTAATVDATGGGTTPYSSAAITLSHTVNPVNDAPVATGSASLAAINEDNTTSTGATVSSLFSSNFSDATDAVTGGSTANTLAGIAISSYTPVNPKGSWQYSTDGSSWSTLNAIASASSAFTLKATDSLRFVPSTNWNGAAPTLAVKLIDSSVSVTTAATVDATGGGTTPYSSAAITLSHTVNPVNDAPVATGSASLAAINEDNTTSTGATVSSLFSSNFSDATDAVTGGSTANTLAGIAISSYTPVNPKGSWQYSTDGSSWSTLNAIASASSAFTLKATDSLRFVPSTNWNGPAPTLAVKLIDSSVSVTTAATVDATGGGTTPYSSAAITLSHTVNPVNDAPVATGSASLAAINEDNTTSTGATVSSLFSSNFSDATDAVTGGSTANTLAGIAISSYTPVNPKGSWQYSTDGSSWSTLNAIASASSAFTLKATDSLRFVPSTNWNGPAPTLAVKLIDSSVSVTTAATVDATGGGTTPYSSAAITLSHTVNPVNDAPAGTDKTITISEDTSYTFSATDFGFSDLYDSPSNSLQAIKITSLPTAGNIKLGGIDITTGQFIDASNIGNLVFSPAANANGNAYSAFTFQVQDSGNTDNYGANLDPTANTITFNVSAVNDAPVVTTSPSTTSVQWSDAIAPITFAASDVDDALPALSLLSYETKLPGAMSFTTGLPVGFSINPGGTAGTWVITGGPTGLEGIGQYQFRVTVKDDENPTPGQGNATSTLNVQPEDVSTSYRGQNWVGTSGTSVTVKLESKISEGPDFTPAFFTGLATNTNPSDFVVRFVDRETGSILASSLSNENTPVVSFAIQGSSVIASANLTVSLPSNVDAQHYIVGTNVSGYVGADTPLEDTIITAAKVGTSLSSGSTGDLGLISGLTIGGATSSTSSMDAAFNIRMNKTNKNLLGTFVGTFTSTVDPLTGQSTSRKTYKIKATSWDSAGLTLGKTGTPYDSISMISKANLSDVTNPAAPISLGGNLNLFVGLRDFDWTGAPSSPTPDQISIRLINSSSQSILDTNGFRDIALTGEIMI